MTRTNTLLVTLALATLSPLAADSAQAGHRSYCWTGPRVGCPGEVHMIRALDYLERAFQARHHGPFDYWMGRVDREIHLALRESCTFVTRRHLRHALAHLHRALRTHAPCDLDEVYEELVDALEHEQAQFRPVHHHHGGTLYVPAPVVPHHGGIMIHGRRFGIHIGF